MMLNLIWQTYSGQQTTLEMEYALEILFKNFEITKLFDNKQYSIVKNNSVIIYSNNNKNIDKEFEIYLEKFKINKYKFYLLHYSNEHLDHNFQYYSKADHVFRNYYDPNINISNVTFVPLGFKSGFKSKTRLVNIKKYDLAFIGQMKNDRHEVIDILKNNNSFIHITNKWDCPTSLTQESCMDIYSKTKFVPCPMGWAHPESFRIMEVLESNSIPILKNYNNCDYIEKVWGKTPLPIVNEWYEINKFLKINTNEYNIMNDMIQDWYDHFRNDLSSKIEKIILSYQ